MTTKKRQRAARKGEAACSACGGGGWVYGPSGAYPITEAQETPEVLECPRCGGTGKGKVASVAAKYNELLYAVARKFPGESRHETALRYIRQAEDVSNGECKQNAEREVRT